MPLALWLVCVVSRMANSLDTFDLVLNIGDTSCETPLCARSSRVAWAAAPRTPMLTVDVYRDTTWLPQTPMACRRSGMSSSTRLPRSRSTSRG